MLDRFPFYLGEQGYDIDRYVSQHEDREGKCVQDLLSGAAMDLFPFTDGSNNTKNKYGQAEAYEHLQQGMTQNSEGSIRSECVKGCTQIYQNTDRSQDCGRQDIHQHIMGVSQSLCKPPN